MRALQAVGVFYQQAGALGIANRYYRDALTKPDARNLPDLREHLLFAVAINEVRPADWRSARKELERFQREFAASVSVRRSCSPRSRSPRRPRTRPS